jgi:hypothetical protein
LEFRRLQKIVVQKRDSLQAAETKFFERQAVIYSYHDTFFDRTLVDAGQTTNPDDDSDPLDETLVLHTDEQDDELRLHQGPGDILWHGNVGDEEDPHNRERKRPRITYDTKENGKTDFEEWSADNNFYPGKFVASEKGFYDVGGGYGYEL